MKGGAEASGRARWVVWGLAFGVHGALLSGLCLVFPAKSVGFKPSLIFLGAIVEPMHFSHLLRPAAATRFAKPPVGVTSPETSRLIPPMKQGKPSFLLGEDGGRRFSKTTFLEERNPEEDRDILRILGICPRPPTRIHLRLQR